MAEQPGEEIPAADDAAAAAPSASFSLEKWIELLKRAVPAEATPAVETLSEKEKAKDSAQNRVLRGWMTFVVVLTFWAELAGIFFLLLWQGRGGDFKLNDWLIGSVTTGVIVQTILVLRVIATHLFPQGAAKMPRSTPDSKRPG